MRKNILCVFIISFLLTTANSVSTLTPNGPNKENIYNTDSETIVDIDEKLIDLFFFRDNRKLTLQ